MRYESRLMTTLADSKIWIYRIHYMNVNQRMLAISEQDQTNVITKVIKQVTQS